VPRLRLGVVLLIPPPLDREVDALRRAVGDGTYGRVPAHVTLVPPVNVNRDHLGEALAALRSSAAGTRPFTVQLGPPTTFLPTSPVLYLPLVGEGRAAVFALRERVFREPLARPLTWPFVPHVTVADEARPDRIAAAEIALCDYAAEVAFDRLHLLEEGPGRIWGPVADFAFAPPAVVGRGGIPLQLVVSHRLDPEARSFADRECVAERRARGLGEEDPDTPNLAVVGRRDGNVVAVVEGWARGGVAWISDLVVARTERREGVGSHLLATFESEAIERGCQRLGTSVPSGGVEESFYRRRGWVEEARATAWIGGKDRVLLRRDR
jgi:2'-5' RNA ligase/ribosomal protein S18 acetylase RimI-like enzyme